MIPNNLNQEEVNQMFKNAEQFLLHNGEEMISRMQLEESSQKTYGYHYKLYVKPFITKHGLGLDTLHKYKLHLGTQRCVGAGANYRFLIFRRFLRRLQAERLLWFDITEDVKVPPKEKRQQKILERPDTDKIIDYLEFVDPEARNYKFKLRLKAMALLMLLQGSRSIEVRHARVEDFDEEKGTLMVKRKGRTGLTELKLALPVYEVLVEYISVWKLKKGLLFGSTSKKNLGGVIDRHSFAHLIQGKNGLFQKAGVVVNTATPHSFRRFHISVLYHYFKDVVKVANHMDLTVSTVLKYIAKDDEEETKKEAIEVVETMYSISRRRKRYEN